MENKNKLEKFKRNTQPVDEDMDEDWITDIYNRENVRFKELKIIYSNHWLPLYRNRAFKFHAIFILGLVFTLIIDGLPISESGLFQTWFGIYALLAILHYVNLLFGRDIFSDDSGDS